MWRKVSVKNTRKPSYSQPPLIVQVIVQLVKLYPIVLLNMWRKFLLFWRIERKFVDMEAEVVTKEKCILSPTDKHKFKDWSLEWAKCTHCGKIVTKDELNQKTDEKGS